MARATFAVARKHRRKKILKRARGMVLSRSTNHKIAKESVRRADRFAHRDRRTRKREFRALWITRISAACEQRGLRYSQFMGALADSDIDLNRKILSEIAIVDPAAFDAIVETAMGVAAKK